MSVFRSIRTLFVALVLAVILMTTSACGSATMQSSQAPALPSATYSQLERGNTSAGQNFGTWVVQTARGLVQDAYVRDENKLGVVITNQVRPNEVRPLARSLTQGFQKNFPARDLTVLMYAPDKQLILTAKYNDSTQRIEYQ